MAKEEKYLSYYDEICVEDEKDVYEICLTASRIIYDKIHLQFDDPKLVGVVFSKTFDAILEELKNSEKDNSSYELNICDRLRIGYTTTDSDEEEKTGNFMIYINHENADNKYDGLDEKSSDLTIKQLCSQYNTNNTKDNPEAIERIQAIAIDRLKKIDVLIGGTSIIMPIFCMTYESLVNMLKQKRVASKQFEYEINFLSCFYILARENEEGDSDISIRPNINAKLTIKSDKMASSIHDD